MENNTQEIGIIELDSHYEIVSNMLSILSGTSFTIHVLTSNSRRASISTDENIKIVRATSRRRWDITHFLAQLHQHAHIIVVTIYKDFRFFYELSKSYSLSFIVHNSHFTFVDNRYVQGLKASLPSYSNMILRNIMFRESYYRKKLLDSVSNLYFLSLSTMRYASVNYSRWGFKFKLLPYIYSTSPIVHNSKDFTIVIPGGVNAANREYHYLKNWLSNISISTPVKIVFLGKSSGRKSKNLISEIADAQDQLKIISFKDYVDQTTYDDWISQADLLLSLLKRKIIFRGYIEQYGTTKITGSINDAIKNSVPLVIPDFYPIDENCRSLLHRYSDLQSFIHIMDSFYSGCKGRKAEIQGYGISQVRSQMLENLKLGNP